MAASMASGRAASAHPMDLTDFFVNMKLQPLEKAMLQESIRDHAQRGGLRVDTACSGADNVRFIVQAIAKAAGFESSSTPFDVPGYACDNDAEVQAFIQKHHNVTHLFDDILDLPLGRANDVLTGQPQLVPMGGNSLAQNSVAICYV